VYSPVTGKVVEVNAALADKPETINEDAYGDGWIFVDRSRGAGAAQRTPRAPTTTPSCSKQKTTDPRPTTSPRIARHPIRPPRAAGFVSGIAAQLCAVPRNRVVAMRHRDFFFTPTSRPFAACRCPFGHASRGMSRVRAHRHRSLRRVRAECLNQDVFAQRVAMHATRCAPVPRRARRRRGHAAVGDAACRGKNRRGLLTQKKTVIRFRAQAAACGNE
jgi:hypothetical protein